MPLGDIIFLVGFRTSHPSVDLAGGTATAAYITSQYSEQWSEMVASGFFNDDDNGPAPYKVLTFF